jgi:superfamily II DNA or RNA helicase
MLSACGWADAKTKSGVITQALLKPELKALEQLGLISISSAAMSSVEAAPAVLDAIVQQAVLNGNFPKIVAAIESLKSLLDADACNSRRKVASGIADRAARITFYQGDVAGFNHSLPAHARSLDQRSTLGLLEPFNRQIFDGTPPELQAYVLIQNSWLALLSGTAAPDLFDAYDAFMQRNQAVSGAVACWWISSLAARGAVTHLRKVANEDQTWSRIADAHVSFLTGDFQRCELLFDQIAALWQTNNNTKTKNSALPFPLGLYQFLILLRKSDPASRKKLKLFLAGASSDWPENLKRIVNVANAAIAFADNPSAESKSAFKKTVSANLRSSLPIIQSIISLICHWFCPEDCDISPATESMSDAAASFAKTKLFWFAALCEDAAGLAAGAGKATTAPGNRHQELGTFPMLQWIEPQAVWKRKLETLRQMVQVAKPVNAKSEQAHTGFDERMIWELNYGKKDYSRPLLRPLIQKFSGKGWTKGRPVGLERLYNNLKSAEFAFLTEQDVAVARTITASQVSTGYYRYTETVYDFKIGNALEALVGHPLIFAPDERTQSIELTLRPPQLVIRKNKDGFRIELSPKPVSNQSLVISKESEQRIALVRFTPQQLKLASILDGAIDCPKSSKAEVLSTAQALSTLLAVQSDIALDADENEANAKSIAAEPRPHLYLSPLGQGLRVEFFVQPFGDGGPLFPPGQGGQNVFTRLNNESLSTTRDFRRELSLASDIVAACSSLARVADNRFSPCDFPVADEALELLSEIEPLREQGVLVLHWPQGKSLEVVGRITPSQLRVKISRDKDWFAATGQIVVDELLKLDLMKLIDLVSVSPGRFIEIGDGRFVALTQQLRDRIGDLAAYGTRHQDSVRFLPIRAAAMMDVDQWCSLKADKHWKACVKRMADASDVVAEVPSTLGTELRDYQIEGFRWLSRLAHWGAGACLADDMGLGKTLQAIALLLRRGGGGPALVVAPTSVCFNWEAELRRFAPTLNPRFFGAGDRDAFFENLGSRDVVITSYGLLNTEAERLQAITWHTAILDEAQAIKNTLTKRSQVAMSLTADFRVILTGTPIENHLGELWNLFQFINPGLLGSLEEYHQRFALPIERDHNREASQQLKRLVQPFLLRRTKTQVLDELPPRTEVTVPVTLTDEEATLYEAARLRAVQQLVGDADDKGRHLRILAEIMRLRRACCHPSLLVPECGLPGAKLTAFSETIDELLANKHKALVFSQFVDHLSILKSELDCKGIAYQYLDGSTPAKQRKRSVEAFQNGEGNLFLISLKAGGTGLNLTAADYVLHMDPWWNPAVEDQASDRAHRLGQLRPVTIYRFITRGTIEEKILELHATKRELADSLLEGTERTGRLSAEELLALIR